MGGSALVAKALQAKVVDEAAAFQCIGGRRDVGWSPPDVAQDDVKKVAGQVPQVQRLPRKTEVADLQPP